MRLLEVRDLRFDDDRIHVRPEVDKDSKEHFLPMDPQLKPALRAAVGPKPSSPERVFAAIPWMTTVRRDLGRACIPYKDEEGRQLDRHAFRSTHATRLLRSGVPVSKARLLTRHAESRTLEKHYNKLGFRDAVTAMEAVPSVAGIPVEGHGRQNGAGKPQ